MTLTEQINADIKAAMLAKEKEKLEALRAVKSAILLAATEKGAGDEMSGDAEIKMLQKLVKQRREAADIFKGQGREDLAEVEEKQAEWISVYLPKQLSEDELRAELTAIISEVGAASMADLGKVMGVASKKLAGRADGKAISNQVKSLLGA